MCVYFSKLLNTVAFLTFLPFSVPYCVIAHVHVHVKQTLDMSVLM